MQRFFIIGTFAALSCAAEKLNVKVCKDATFLIEGPICSDSGNACPKKGDATTLNCEVDNPSYDPVTQTCIAPEDAECIEVQGEKLCHFPLSGNCEDGAGAAADQGVNQMNTTPTTASNKNLRCRERETAVANGSIQRADGKWEISLCGDATYVIDGPICSGDGAAPAGTLCPKQGDKTKIDCHPHLKTYDPLTQECTAPEDGVCVNLGAAWGCTYPSLNFAICAGV